MGGEAPLSGASLYFIAAIALLLCQRSDRPASPTIERAKLRSDGLVQMRAGRVDQSRRLVTSSGPTSSSLGLARGCLRGGTGWRERRQAVLRPALAEAAEKGDHEEGEEPAGSLVRQVKELQDLAVNGEIERVGFANSGGLVFVDEPAEEVTAPEVGSRFERRRVATVGRQ
jgi:hypothetical protein